MDGKLKEITIKIPEEIADFLEWYLDLQGYDINEYILDMICCHIHLYKNLGSEEPAMVVDNVIIPEKLKLGYEKIMEY